MDAKVWVHQGIKPRSQLYYQVLLLEVSAVERNIVKNVPEKKIYIKSSFILCSLFFWIVYERGQILGIQPPKMSSLLFVKSEEGRVFG